MQKVGKVAIVGTSLLSACRQCTVKDFKGFKSFCSGFEEEVLLHYREVKFFPGYN